jgi:hypothetical protein
LKINYFNEKVSGVKEIELKVYKSITVYFLKKIVSDKIKIDES